MEKDQIKIVLVDRGPHLRRNPLAGHWDCACDTVTVHYDNQIDCSEERGVRQYLTACNFPNAIDAQNHYTEVVVHRLLVAKTINVESP